MEEQMMQHFHREIKSMAANISRVFTFCYHAIYGRADEEEWSMAEKLEPSFSKDINAQIAYENENEWLDTSGVMTRLKQREENGGEIRASQSRKRIESGVIVPTSDGQKEKPRGKRKRRRDEGSTQTDSEEDEIEVSDDDEDEDIDKDRELGAIDPEPEMTAMCSSEDDEVDEKDENTESEMFDTLRIEDATSSINGASSSSSKKKKTKKNGKSSKSSNSSSKRQRTAAPKPYEPMAVSLRTSSIMMANLLSYVYENGALTDDEYRTSMRYQFDFPVNAAVLKKLKKEAEEREDRASPQNGEKKPGQQKKKKKGDSHPETQKKGAGKGGNQVGAKGKEPRSMRKGNEKRSMQAQQMQTTNATEGRKGNSSTTARSKRPGAPTQ
jgi:hypothetical protein